MSEASGGASALMHLVAELLAQLEGTAVTECELQAGSQRVLVRRSPNMTAARPVATPIEEAIPNHWRPIIAPLTGVFYIAEKPQSPPMVRLGMMVGRGQPVGLIESMKMFNPVESDVTGTVRAILVANGTVVEANQVLIYVEPLGEEA